MRIVDQNRAPGLLAFIALLIAVAALIVAVMGRATNMPPVAIAGEDVVAVAGDPVRFEGIAGDGDGSVIRFEWDFDGDGTFDYSSPSTGFVEHAYPPNPSLAGQVVNLTAVFRATDNAGAVDTDTRTVSLRYEIPRITAQATRQGAYWLVTLAGATNAIRTNEARFVVRDDGGAIRFISTINDAGTVRSDRDADGQFDIWAIPPDLRPITNGTGAPWTAADLFDARNARFVYADDSFDRDVNDPDRIAVYADVNNDGAADVLPGYAFEIWDATSGNAILVRLILPA